MCSFVSLDRSWRFWLFWKICNWSVSRMWLFSVLPVGVLLEYLHKMIFFIKRSEISSSDVFLTIRMQVAVSATTDFKCDIISIRQQSGKFFLWCCLWSNCINRITKVLLLRLKCCLSWSKSFLFQFCIVFIEIFLTSAFCPVFFLRYFLFCGVQKIYLV